MSIKRSHRSSGSGRRQGGDSGFSFIKPPEPEPEKSWDEHMAGKPDEAFVPYSLKSRYAKGALLLHPKFGKGVVVVADVSRIEVLFADRKIFLGHGAP